LDLERGFGIAGHGVFICTHRAWVLTLQNIAFHGFGDKLDSLGMILHGYSLALDLISLIALGCVVFGSLVAQSGVFTGIAAGWALLRSFFVLFWAIPWMWGEGSDLDIRVLPVLFVVILATARCGKAREMAGCDSPSSLRRADGERDAAFCRRADGNSLVSRVSFDAVPRGALVVPIVEGDQDPIERPFTHFWGLWSNPQGLVLALSNGHSRRDADADHP